MTLACERLREALAEHGAAFAEADPAARSHLAECQACYELLEALIEVEGALEALPPIRPPRETVARAVEAVREQGAAGREGEGPVRSSSEELDR